MHLHQAFADIRHVPRRALPVERALALQFVGQRSARHVLHHQVMPVVNGNPGIHTHDVRMLDLGQQMCVVAQRLECAGLGAASVTRF